MHHNSCDLLYSLFIHIYVFAIRIASLWNGKAKAWADGRKDWKARLLAIRQDAADRQVLLVHCASLGEFEQGRPVIEALRERYPRAYIVLSFFSPSGYEVRKKYDKADAVIYLPADSPANARAFTGILAPSLVIFVKYEYWLNLLAALEQRKVPVLMVSSIFREGQVFFRWYGGAWRRILGTIDHFFLQDAQSAGMLRQLGIADVTVAGDTRFDRVLEIAEMFSPIPEVETFCGKAPVLVAGSTWKEDENIIAAYMAGNAQLRCIIAPHEINESHLGEIGRLFPGSVRFSALKEGRVGEGEHRVLIIDNIGMLSRLYHYGHISYIGGGFGKGIHNTLEAAVHGQPVIFGPRYAKFREAVELIQSGAAFSIEDAGQYGQAMDRLLADDVFRKQCGSAALAYVRQNAGATSKILDHIQEKRLLTN